MFLNDLPEGIYHPVDNDAADTPATKYFLSLQRVIDILYSRGGTRTELEATPAWLGHLDHVEPDPTGPQLGSGLVLQLGPRGRLDSLLTRWGRLPLNGCSCPTDRPVDLLGLAPHCQWITLSRRGTLSRALDRDKTASYLTRIGDHSFREATVKPTFERSSVRDCLRAWQELRDQAFAHDNHNSVLSLVSQAPRRAGTYTLEYPAPGRPDDIVQTITHYRTADRYRIDYYGRTASQLVAGAFVNSGLTMYRST